MPSRYLQSGTMTYQYNGREPTNIPVDKLTDRHKELIFNNKSFCMLPWMHIHSFPDGKAFPCCMTDMNHSVGNTKTSSISEIWNDDPMKDVRRKMLAGETVDGCKRCIEQEDAGFFSMRYSSNKHFGHNIKFVDDTASDGSAPLHLTYWDIRFSNLCNLRCRSCGHIFSSNWYDDQVKIIENENGKEHADNWKKNNKRLFFSGRHQNDMYDQLSNHLDEVEQIYFAGGEPLIMEEHYRLLTSLIEKNLTNVRLIYNTNFTEMSYKKTNFLDLWPQFNSVSIGASLDAMGPLAEYMRKGTDWYQIEKNREEMLVKCPNVDFYLNSTLSIMNLWHLPLFHRNWVDRGFIKAQDLNVNILQEPTHFRIDILPIKFRDSVKELYNNHIQWLEPQDKLTRATIGFKGAIQYLEADDKSHLLPKFWGRTNSIDAVRGENAIEIIPELLQLMENK